MKISACKRAMSACINARQPVLLWGPPGTGKSSVVRQIATELSWRFIDFRPVVRNPIDLVGMPVINRDTKQTDFFPPSFLPVDGEGIFCIEEIGQAGSAMQAACMQLTLDRCIGDYKLPDGWVVVACSNRVEDRAGVGKIITPLANRFTHLTVEVCPDDWQTWAGDNNIDSTIRSFIKVQPQHLHKFDAKSEELAQPTPRTWAFLSNLLATNTMSDETLFSLAAGTVGSSSGQLWINHRRLALELPDPTDILRDPSNAVVAKEPSLAYAIIYALCSHLRDPNTPTALLDAYVTYVTRYIPEYTAMALTELMRTHAKILMSAKCSAWMTKHAALIRQTN